MGTGLRPQRPPGWSKGQLPITAQSPQGPSALRGDRTSQGPVPDDASAMLGQADDYLAKQMAGRPGQQYQSTPGGGGGNMSAPAGPATSPKTTGRPIEGKTTPRGPTPGTF